MNRFLLASFGARAHADDNSVIRPGQFLPPLLPGVEVINFDYSPLLVAQQLVMDELSYQIISDKSSGVPSSAIDQMRILHDEGFLYLVKYNEITKIESQNIINSTNKEIRENSNIAEITISLIDNWYDFGKQYGKQFGDVFTTGTIPYALNAYVGRRGHYDDADFAAEQWEKIKISKNADPSFFTSSISEIAQIALDHALTSVTVANYFGCANFEWKNYQTLLQKIGTGRIESARSFGAAENPQIAREFAKIIIPYDFPTGDMRPVIRLLKDKRIQYVRDVISNLDKDGVEIDDALRKDFIKALLEANQIARKREVWRWRLKPLTLMLDFIPGAHIFGEGVKAIPEIGMKIGEKIFDAALEIGADSVVEQRRERRKMVDAMYVIQEHLGGNKKNIL